MKNIVLTGGPCGGKSSSIDDLKRELEERGYHVFVLDESATRLINKGIKPFGDDANVTMYQFQKIILYYQLYREALIRSKARLYKNSVIIYDRGVIDNKAYLSEELWNKLLEETHLNEEKLYNRYDLVCHLVTVEDGKKDCYTTENNNARSEGAAEALEKDLSTMNAWYKHPNFKVFPNYDTFEGKKHLVKKAILSYLGEKDCPTKQYKYYVDLTNTNMNLISGMSSKFNIIQTYLKTDLCEKRLRCISINGVNTYYLTEKYKNIDGNEVKESKRISYIEYKNLLKDKDYDLIKTRYCFINNKDVYHLDIFNNSNIGILEVETDKLDIPDYLAVIKRTDIRNYNIAKN